MRSRLANQASIARTAARRTLLSYSSASDASVVVDDARAPLGARERGALMGVVVEPTTGLPVPNVEVRVLGTDRVVRSDTVGQFRLTVTMSIELDILPARLSEVLVKAREERYRTRWKRHPLRISDFI